MFQWFAQYGVLILAGLAFGLAGGWLLFRQQGSLGQDGPDETDRRHSSDLEDSEARYRLLAENASDVIWTVNWPDLTFSYISPSIKRLRGISVDKAMKEAFPESLVPGQREWMKRLIEERVRAFESGHFGESEARRVEVRQLHSDGSEVCVEIIASLIVDKHRRVTGIQGISRNVTARVRAERERQSREAILHALARAARMLFSAEVKEEVMHSALEVLGKSVGADRVYVFENHRHHETGDLLASQRYEWCGPGIQPEIDNDEMQNMSYAEVLPNWLPIYEAGEAVFGPVEEMEDEERELLEPQGILSIAVVPIYLDGQFWGQIGFDDCTRVRQWSQAEIDALEVAAGTIGGAIRSMRTEEELRRLVSTDSLTGVSSRRAFLEYAKDRFDAARSEGGELSLLIMDLDHFKAINDAHGHPAGDQALKAFAKICRHTLRDDDVIGRTGGEEFAVVLDGANAKQAEFVAEKLRRQVEKTAVEADDGELNLSVSIGVAAMMSGDRDFGQLLKRADDALYSAKNSGRNRVQMAAQASV